MATKLKIPKKESQETPQEEKEEHKPIPKEKGPVEYPKDHKAAMVVTSPGASCFNCLYWDGDDCENEYYRRYNKGSGQIPVSDPKTFCSDWWTPRK